VSPSEAAPVEVSVVLACRDAAEYLPAQLEALSRQAWPGSWEVVVSDNGSRDDSLEVVERYRPRLPRLVVVNSSARPGPGAARNVGVEAAAGARIVFCDADDVVGNGWLRAMAAALEAHDLVAARMEHSSLNRPSGVRERREEPGLLQSRPPFLPYAMACALGVRRSVHEALGGFDETFRDAGEDRDYCYRAQFAGFRLVLVPAAVVHYRHRNTIRGVYRQSRAYGRGHVQTYRAYRDRGLARPPPARALANWLVLPVHLLAALRGHRALMGGAWRLGWRVGRLEGCLRYRVWAP
jgi:GT2 family glycosyltransferase